MPISEIDRSSIAAALAVKGISHDPDRRVGAAIALPDGNLIAVGTNQPPSRLEYSIEQSHHATRNDPRWKYFVLEHAERTAISNAYREGRSPEGATMYVTLFPCSDCARAISLAGIKRMVVPHTERPTERDHKWLEHYKYAEQILLGSGISIDFYEDGAVE
jgi:dCMP deaminase